MRSSKLRVLLDEGVPLAVAHCFQEAGHEVIPFESVLRRASHDNLVCRAAEANDAILVAFDKDMKQAARSWGISNERFKKLSLIHFQRPEPKAAKRLAEAMSFVVHECEVSTKTTARRMYVEIGKQVLRTHR